MESRRLIRCLFSLFFLLSLISGCQGLHVYRPVSVLVRDAETKKPIPGAEVQIGYPVNPGSLSPAGSSGRTSEDGIARLRAAPHGYAILMNTTAKGYQAEDQELPVDTIQKIEPSSWLKAAEQRPTSFVVEMYAEPRFSVELIVPDGYRGLVRAQVEVQEGASFPVGQRSFRYEVPASGIVPVRGPAPLLRLSAPDFQARTAKGVLLKETTDLVTVGFRWLKREGNEHFFVVGTLNDYEVFRRRYAPKESSDDPSPSLPGGDMDLSGGEGHHHKRKSSADD